MGCRTTKERETPSFCSQQKLWPGSCSDSNPPLLPRDSSDTHGDQRLASSISFTHDEDPFRCSSHNRGICFVVCHDGASRSSRGGTPQPLGDAQLHRCRSITSSHMFEDSLRKRRTNPTHTHPPAVAGPSTGDGGCGAAVVVHEPAAADSEFTTSTFSLTSEAATRPLPVSTTLPPSVSPRQGSSLAPAPLPPSSPLVKDGTAATLPLAPSSRYHESAPSDKSDRTGGATTTETSVGTENDVSDGARTTPRRDGAALRIDGLQGSLQPSPDSHVSLVVPLIDSPTKLDSDGTQHHPVFRRGDASCHSAREALWAESHRVGAGGGRDRGDPRCPGDEASSSRELFPEADDRGRRRSVVSACPTPSRTFSGSAGGGDGQCTSHLLLSLNTPPKDITPRMLHRVLRDDAVEPSAGPDVDVRLHSYQDPATRSSGPSSPSLSLSHNGIYAHRPRSILRKPHEGPTYQSDDAHYRQLLFQGMSPNVECTSPGPPHTHNSIGSCALFQEISTVRSPQSTPLVRPASAAAGNGSTPRRDFLLQLPIPAASRKGGSLHSTPETLRTGGGGVPPNLRGAVVAVTCVSDNPPPDILLAAKRVGFA